MHNYEKKVLNAYIFEVLNQPPGSLVKLELNMPNVSDVSARTKFVNSEPFVYY
jgi:hypothetical protein